MDSLPLVLPTTPAPSRRAPLPILAAVVPVAGGVVLWLVTGSLYALCFAALGPIMIGASAVDAARHRRRERREGEARAERDWAAVEAELVRRHQEERDALRLHAPDVAGCLAQPPLRGTRPPAAGTSIVVGAGSVSSAVRCSGADDERGRSFRMRAGVLERAPIVVPLGGGISVRGAQPLVEAVVRALAVQLCLRFGPAQLTIVGERLEEYGLAGLPHAARVGGSGLSVAIGAVDDARSAADAAILMLPPGADVPEGTTTVIDVAEPTLSSVRTPHAVIDVAVECLSREQAVVVAGELAGRRDDAERLPEAVALHQLEQPDDAEGLAAVIGRDARGPVVVDIVSDGPHALVTGTTGTGKSELLVTWVAAMAAKHGPERVVFVLADFKGGTAFEPLRELRQVAAVITDLDDEGARRGVSSLAAELRRRERLLAAAGVRDVRDAAIPRLVVVVDEFAALLAEHPDLGAIFTDIAARGRALGMHVILGTQRAAGIVRDALAANCPLRISLRVGDAADSRLMIGTDAAASLPGGTASRGVALMRRPTDTEPVPVRIALTGAADVSRVAGRWAAAPRPLSPWLPALPTRVGLAELTARSGGVDEIVLGLADEPDRQEQPLEVLRSGEERGLVVVGGAGSGKTTVLRAIADQRPDALWLPDDAEVVWDLVIAWASGEESPPPVVLADDVDALVASLPPDYGQQLAQGWEQVLRTSPGSLFVLTAGRSAGQLGRALDLVPKRAVLRMPNRIEHLAAGGEASAFLRRRTPGRATIGEREVQLVWSEHDVPRAHRSVAESRWTPRAASTALVSPGAPAAAERLQHAHPHGEVLLVGAEPSAKDRPRIFVADAETWQRNWSTWQRIRAEGEVLVRAEHPVDLRQLVGVRTLPPFARLHEGRAWSVRGSRPPERVVLPELSPRTQGRSRRRRDG
ncbi:FtsK/SpoIIIE domain-containing protein [Microbacterium algeriense]|uniref:FtsK/SpoIIIE domain-containing protein n=1 Tax=Microbacterium algeriense TaxID=2615184 RepID=UPI003D74CD65